MKNLQTVKQSWRYLALASIFLMGVITIVGSSHETPPLVPGQQSSSVVRVVELDFEPIGSTSFDPICTGDHMVYTDAKMFRPIIVLDEPAPTGFSYFYYIQEDGALSNPTIGYVLVRFNAGDTEPSSITTENDLTTVESFLNMNIARMPVGAPAQQAGAFWLGCTQSCVIRGNGPRGDAGPQNVFLSTSQFVQYDDASVVSDFVGLARTPNHTVQCLQ